LIVCAGVLYRIARAAHPPGHRPGTRTGLPASLLLAGTCAAGSLLIVGPWMIRNKLVGGHLALSYQSGASLAYHKVADVMLWAAGRHDYRFDSRALDDVRSQIDRRLVTRYAERFGPLSAAQQAELRWETLNYGTARSIDAFAASSLLWEIGLDILREHPMAAAQCFAVQGLSMLAFPLGLVIDPPAGGGAIPLSSLGGQVGVRMALAGLIGVLYAALAGACVWRLLAATWRRSWPTAFFAFWPAAALFVLSLPFEDPRFRLPIIPFLWIMAVGEHASRPARPDAGV
jgi:hypothetical protein